MKDGLTAFASALWRLCLKGRDERGFCDSELGAKKRRRRGVERTAKKRFDPSIGVLVPRWAVGTIILVFLGGEWDEDGVGFDALMCALGYLHGSCCFPVLPRSN